MTHTEMNIAIYEAMLAEIASFGYRVYSIPGKYRGTDQLAVADPEDGPEGFYLVVDDVTTAYTEMKDFLLVGEDDLERARR